ASEVDGVGSPAPGLPPAPGAAAWVSFDGDGSMLAPLLLHATKATQGSRRMIVLMAHRDCSRCAPAGASRSGLFWPFAPSQLAPRRKLRHAHVLSFFAR